MTTLTSRERTNRSMVHGISTERDQEECANDISAILQPAQGATSLNTEQIEVMKNGNFLCIRPDVNCVTTGYGRRVAFPTDAPPIDRQQQVRLRKSTRRQNCAHNRMDGLLGRKQEEGCLEGGNPPGRRGSRRSSASPKHAQRRHRPAGEHPTPVQKELTPQRMERICLPASRTGGSTS